MLKRKEHENEAITGYGEVKEYAQKHEKQARSMYGTFLKKVRSAKPTGKYLEVGAGIGILTCLLAQEHPEITITACDFSQHMVDLARKYARGRGLEERIRYTCADVNDAEEMGRLGTFDLVYSAYSLHHWRDPERSILNLWNALKDDGMLYIYDLRRVWWLYLLPMRGGFMDSIRASYRPSEIQDIFRSLGITEYGIETAFPGFIQSIIAWK
jgi:2-polyprenyl-3-methyl-5-hydroxy-6-metoxy-1,4-benzoquinol methylase